VVALLSTPRISASYALARLLSENGGAAARQVRSRTLQDALPVVCSWHDMNDNLGDARAVAVSNILATRGVDVNHATRQMPTALFEACLSGHTDVMRRLLAHPDINVNKGDVRDNGATPPLFIACMQGRLEAARLLLQHHDIRVNVGCAHIGTPLCIACINRHADVVRLLLAHPDTQVNMGRRMGAPLDWACENGYTDLVRLLLAHPDILDNKAALDGHTPISRARHRNYPDIVQLLQEHRMANRMASSANAVNAANAANAVKAAAANAAVRWGRWMRTWTCVSGCGYGEVE
jgi:serine/threonine-protein phosphatase 6 regulatory ankyrin repeat subunit B